MTRFSVLCLHQRLLCAFCVSLFLSAVLCGQTDVKSHFDLPADDLESSIKRYALQSGLQVIISSDDLGEVRTREVRGVMTARQALDAMVAETGLTIVQDDKTGAFSLKGKRRPDGKKNTSLPAKSSSSVSGVGILSGRVYNLVSGNYLNNARITIEGVEREIRTNAFGEYVFGELPAGPVVLKVLVSGYAPASANAVVVSGTTTTVNIPLRLNVRTVDSDSPTVLESFVVAAQREMSGSSVAINERRAAANLKNVVAADEFGDSTEGNVGEFVKYLPGVSIDYTGADARFISVRGLPNFGTAVMIDGNRMASASAGFSRGTELDQVSLNNMARIEVAKSPLPDTPADTVGGSVNMVLKSAFERSKPVLNYRLSVSANFNDAQGVNYATFEKTPGPGREATIKMKPGFDFTYINPVSPNFGYTVTGLTSNQFTQESFSASQWRPTSVTSTLSTADRPFLGNFTIRDAPKDFYRLSFGTTLDWRIGKRDVISVGGQWNRFDTSVVNSDMLFDPTGSRNAVPASFGPDNMVSASTAGRASQTLTYQHKIGTGYNLRLTHRHTGSLWTLENGAAYSSSVSTFLGAEDNAVRTITVRLPNVTLRYDDILRSLPGRISTLDANNRPVDYRELDNYRLDSVTTANSEQRNTTSSAFASMVRQFASAVPFRLKAGVDIRREDRDFRNPTDTFTFVGPDRIANTADDSLSLYDLVWSDYYSIPQPFGYGLLERPSNHKAYNLLLSYPQYFSKNEATAISSAATQSRKLTETVAAGYVRGDLGFFKNRLKLAGGVRYERTYDEGYGVLNDIGLTYERTANGQIVRDSAGRPVKVAGDAAALARLQYRDRGAYAKRNYGDFYPSLNAIFELTPKLLLRAAYAETITRPQLSNIVPSTTATDPTVTTGTQTITVSNTALKPWTSKGYDLALEYYFEQPGIVSVGVFRKDIRDFFGMVRLPVTPEILAEYGFDESYSGYELVTRENVGDARVSGVEFEYRQTLFFLPHWARGVSFFANGTALHLEGASTADFSGFISKTTNWGLSLSRPRFTLKMNWNLRGRQRLAPVTGTNVPSGSYIYATPRLSQDVNLEVRLTKHLTLFANVRNIADVEWREQVYGPETPAYARDTKLVKFGAQGIFGIKGTF